MKGLSATDKDNCFVELEFSFRPSASWEEAQSSEGFEGRKEGLIAFLPARITCFVCLFFSCLQTHQILPSQQPYCLCILHEYYQENLQSCKVTCCTGPLRVKCLYVPPLCQGSCASKKNVPKVVFIHGLYFFQSHNEQHYYFHFRRTKRRYLLLKTFFLKNEFMENPVVLIQMNYTIR